MDKQEIPQVNFRMGARCVYCGDTARERDHVIPVSFLELDPTRKKQVGMTVPSCVECNSLLSDQMDSTMMDRCERVNALIAQKHHKRLCRQVRWEEDDLSELDANLAGFCRAEFTKTEAIKDRLSFLGAADFYEVFSELIYYPELDVESHKFSQFAYEFFFDIIIIART